MLLRGIHAAAQFVARARSYSLASAARTLAPTAEHVSRTASGKSVSSAYGMDSSMELKRSCMETVVIASARVAVVIEEPAEVLETMQAMNRNIREPNGPNHGKRPCSNIRRRRKLHRRSNEHPLFPVKKKKGYDT